MKLFADGISFIRSVIQRLRGCVLFWWACFSGLWVFSVGVGGGDTESVLMAVALDDTESVVVCSAQKDHDMMIIAVVMLSSLLSSWSWSSRSSFSLPSSSSS